MSQTRAIRVLAAVRSDRAVFGTDVGIRSRAPVATRGRGPAVIAARDPRPAM